MGLKKTGRILKKLNKEKKDQTKTLAIIFIVMSIFVVLVAAIAIYQTTKVSELKASIIEKDKTIAVALGKITGLEADVIKLEADVAKLKKDIVAMANQAIEGQEKLKALALRIFQFVTKIRVIYTRWNCFEGNFCTDEKIVSDTWEWIKAAKAGAEK